MYELEVETFWSEELFPKQYPQWRPPPQWSRTLGILTDGATSLYTEGKCIDVLFAFNFFFSCVGEVVGDEFKDFVENSESLSLELKMVESGMVETGDDVVHVLPVTSGVGARRSTIFVRGSKNKVRVYF